MSSIVATAEAPTLAYVTKGDLAAALADLEGKIAGMLVSVGQGGKKQEHSPSPDPP